MRFDKEDETGWGKIDGGLNIDLGEYSVIRKPEDWRKGMEKALYTILDRIEASKDVKQRAEELLEKVDEKQAEFSGKSRLTIAASIAYFALKGNININKMAEAGSISTASIKNTIEMMGNRMDLN